MCCTHPIGDIQDSHDTEPSPIAEMSPASRSTQATPSTRMAKPRALRALSVSCAVTAATPAKNHPASVNSAPKRTDPPPGAPDETIVQATIRPSTRLAPSVVISAAASCADRPTTVAPISSARPCSSSVRVCLITVSAANRPITTGMDPARQTTSSSTLFPGSWP